MRTGVRQDSSRWLRLKIDAMALDLFRVWLLSAMGRVEALRLLLTPLGPRTGGEMFCTVNGARCKGQDPRLDFAASDVANGLYPALSVGVPQSRRGGCLKVNFGERPFVYGKDLYGKWYGKDFTPVADALIVEDPY